MQDGMGSVAVLNAISLHENFKLFPTNAGPLSDRTVADNPKVANNLLNFSTVRALLADVTISASIHFEYESTTIKEHFPHERPCIVHVKSFLQF